MPSDAKKREQQKKKEAAKARGGKKDVKPTKPQNDKESSPTNGDVTNGIDKQMTAEGIIFFTKASSIKFFISYR